MRFQILYRGCLIDLDLEVCFDEEFNQENDRKKRLLSPNRISHRKVFVNVCEELLSMLPIKNELNYVEMSTDRSKMEK